MDFYTPKFRRDPNEKVQSLYWGVANGNRVVTSLVKHSPVADRMEATRAYEPPMQRGVGGRCAVLVIGGMETTLDEVEYILEAKKQKPFKPQRNQGEIASMCQLVMERRNDAIRHFRRNPSEAPKPKKRTARIYLPSGYQYRPTSVPGLKVLARI